MKFFSKHLGISIDRKAKYFVGFYLFICGLSLLSPIFELSAQQVEKSKPEIGFWVGAANPRPGAETSTILDTTLGFGKVVRVYTKVGLDVFF